MGAPCTPCKQFAQQGTQKRIRGWVILDWYIQFLGVPHTLIRTQTITTTSKYFSLIQLLERR